MRTPAVCLLAALHMACAAPPAATLTPSAGSMAGGYTVDVAWAGGAPSAVTLGGVVAWVVAEEDGGFTLEVQGAPSPGPAALRFTADGEAVEVPDAFTYAAPIDPAFDRFAAIGASIGAGVQSAGLTAQMARQSAPAALAGLAGAWLGLPQLAEGFFPPVEPADVGAGCDLPSYDQQALESFTAALAAMRDEEGELDWARGRRDATVDLRNLAVPGAALQELAYGPPDADVAAFFFAHLFHEPEGELTDLPERSQLEHLVALEPTLVVGMDLLGNDVLDALEAGEGLDPEQVRPLDVTRPALRDILAATAGTGAAVFLADLPRPSLLPAAADAVARLRASGASEDEIAADLAAVDAHAAAYSAALVEDAAAYDNVVVVPLAAAVEAIAADGLDVGGTVLTTRALGGLVGLDGVHFTATGNAFLANLFADSIDAALGTSLPRADLAATLAVDPYGPDALAAAGLDPAGCR